MTEVRSRLHWEMDWHSYCGISYSGIAPPCGHSELNSQRDLGVPMLSGATVCHLMESTAPVLPVQCVGWGEIGADEWDS